MYTPRGDVSGALLAVGAGAGDCDNTGSSPPEGRARAVATAEEGTTEQASGVTAAGAGARTPSAARRRPGRGPPAPPVSRRLRVRMAGRDDSRSTPERGRPS